MIANCLHCKLSEPRRAHDEKCVRHETRELGLRTGEWHECVLYRGPSLRDVRRLELRSDQQARALAEPQEVLF